MAGDDGVESDIAGESSLLKTLKNGPFIEIKDLYSNKQLESHSNNQIHLNLCLLDYTSPWEPITFSQMASFLCFN